MLQTVVPMSKKLPCRLTATDTGCDDAKGDMDNHAATPGQNGTPVTSGSHNVNLHVGNHLHSAAAAAGTGMQQGGNGYDEAAHHQAFEEAFHYIVDELKPIKTTMIKQMKDERKTLIAAPMLFCPEQLYESHRRRFRLDDQGNISAALSTAYEIYKANMEEYNLGVGILGGGMATYEDFQGCCIDRFDDYVNHYLMKIVYPAA
ncbi:uncharacterized protein LOC62_02G003363 [Vanrija pseudolonga]|uniref:Uncharacterized protein n=1 Tax=Vanrija pseudolonga TaxID=143232 RepID=A0AAF0Y3Y5_9TREE|nr:hypothetical protein LOC62_02G003363 [Vanrija pseudolonga]